MRGGITKGKFYEDDLFVHGKALIKAVELEEKHAIYPRILIDSNCLNCYEVITAKNGNCTNCKNNIQKMNIPCINYCNRKNIKMDNDGLYSVNPYYSQLGDFESFKNQLISVLMQYKGDLKIRQKIMWLIAYHNDFCRKDLNCGRFASNPIITDEEIADAIK